MKKRIIQSFIFTLSCILLFSSVPLSAVKREKPRFIPQPPVTKIAPPRIKTQDANTKSQAEVIGQTSTLLSDGSLLVIGGQGPDGVRAAIELKEPGAGSETRPITNLHQARAWHT